LSPRLGMLVAAAEALVADDDEAQNWFSRALAIPGIERWPFDQARVQLLRGERLRRARATSESRPYLKAALATFERLGARPWADRAAAELHATGEPATIRPRAGLSTLTGQESTIATLAARGLTNKSIAAQLNLSHRTIGAHLSRVFQKVGINSRAALRDALDAAA
jgi:DNA-binding CsgD family transcriptional regulator